MHTCMYTYEGKYSHKPMHTYANIKSTRALYDIKHISPYDIKHEMHPLTSIYIYIYIYNIYIYIYIIYIYIYIYTYFGSTYQNRSMKYIKCCLCTSIRMIYTLILSLSLSLCVCVCIYIYIYIYMYIQTHRPIYIYICI